jgi:hypoxanthine-guanine phosphoribosyltransferase
MSVPEKNQIKLKYVILSIPPISSINWQLVDDIIDTGLTISKLSAELRQKIGQDGRLWTALLVSKRTDQRMPMDSCRADFVAFNIPNKLQTVNTFPLPSFPF